MTKQEEKAGTDALNSLRERFSGNAGRKVKGSRAKEAADILQVMDLTEKLLKENAQLRAQLLPHSYGH